MKTLKMNQFDEKEEEIADTLISLGMSHWASVKEYKLLYQYRLLNN